MDEDDRSSPQAAHEVSEPGKATAEEDRVNVRLDALSRELDAVRRRTQTNDEEIDLLQIESAKKGRKWYQEPAIMISVLALAASVVATILSQVSTASERSYQQRTRLTAVLQQIHNSQAKGEELALQYGDRAPVPTVTEVQLLAREAELLSNEVSIEPFERIVIAEAHYYVNDLDTALRVALAAQADSKSPLDSVLAKRTIARIHFRQGNVNEARSAFGAAAEVPANPQSQLFGFVRSQYVFENSLNWAREELYSGNCIEAAGHSTKATEAVLLFPQSMRSVFTRRATELGNQIIAECRP